MKRKKYCILLVYILLALKPMLGQQNIPNWALSDQLNRKTFQFNMVSAKVIDVRCESDFRKSSDKDVIYNLKNDILFTQPLVISGSRSVRIIGNGHNISPKYTNPLVFSKPMRSESWSYNTNTKEVKITLEEQSDWDNIGLKDSVSVFYEAWYLRLNDKVTSVNGRTICFTCGNTNLQNPKFMQLTPKPVIFLGKRKFPISNQKSLSTLITIANGARVQMLDVSIVGVDAKECIHNKGDLQILNSHISNCENISIRSYGTLFVENSTFNNITKYPIVSHQNAYLDIQNCKFDKIGMRGSNVACVFSCGDAYVANNKFHDFNYCAIYFGYSDVSDAKVLASTIAENNLFSWSKGWERKMKWYGLVDGGAIYVSTNNKRCIIRHNRVVRFGGHGSNRGIYLDDGAYNVTVYGNVVKDVRNSYDIDARDCSRSQFRKMPVGYATNTFNYIGYNVFSNRVRMEGSSVIANQNSLFENNAMVGNLDVSKNVIGNNRAGVRPLLHDPKARISSRGKAHLKNSKSIVVIK